MRKRVIPLFLVLALLLGGVAVFAHQAHVNNETRNMEKSRLETEARLEEAKTPALDEAALFVQSEAKRLNQGGQIIYAPEYPLVSSAMNYVQANVSPLIYASLENKKTAHGNKKEEALQRHAGLCGLQVEVFLEIMQRVGVQARRVQFYSIDTTGGGNHVTAEVWFNNKWNLVDVTFGTFFRHPGDAPDHWLSAEEVLQLKNPEHCAVSNEANIVYQGYINSGQNPLSYLHSTTRDVIIGGNGTIHLKPDGEMNYPLVNLPKHFGVHQPVPPGEMATMVYHLAGLDGKSKLVFDIAAIGGKQGTIVVEGRNGENSWNVSAAQRGTMEISLEGLDVSDGVLVKATPTDTNEVFYVVLQGIRAE